MSTLDMHKEVGQGAEGIGGSQQQHQPASLRPESRTRVSFHPLGGNQLHNHLVTRPQQDLHGGGQEL